MKLHRLFFGTPLPATVCRDAGRVIRRLDTGSNLGAKWTETEQLHLTLKFLGGTMDDRIYPVIKAARVLEERFSPFPMAFAQHLDAFPSHTKPNTLYVGLQQGAEEMIALATALEDLMLDQGFPQENRPYVPHLTLGRLAQGRASHEAMALFEKPYPVTLGSAIISEFKLYESELTSRGPFYTPLATFHLRG